MKTLHIIITLLFISFAMSSYAQKEEKTVIFHTDIDCLNCKKELEQNIPYEKGVKNLIVDLKSKTVAITFRTDKNSVEELKKAIEKQNVKIFDDSKCNSSCEQKCGEGNACQEKFHEHHEHDDCCDKK